MNRKKKQKKDQVKESDSLVRCVKETVDETITVLIHRDDLEKILKDKRIKKA